LRPEDEVKSVTDLFKGQYSGQTKPQDKAGDRLNRSDSPSPVLLSVVITTYNRPDMLELCLEGFKRQKLDPSKFEIIIVDDGSKSRSDELVRRYNNEMPVRYIYQQNAGFAAARNTGIAAAKGNVIVPYDDDNRPHPDCLTRHYGFHLTNPSLEDAMQGLMEWTPGLEITPLMHYVPEVDPRLWRCENIRQGQLLPFGCLWGGCSSYKKELIQKAGGFNPDFRFGCEDTEAEFRMRQHGLRVHFDRYAINYVSKPLDYEEFCNRSYKRGKSLWRLKRLYPASRPIRKYTNISNPHDAILKYQNIASRVDSIKKMLSKGWSLAPTGAEPPSFALLYRCLHASFEYWKNKGFLDEMQAQKSLYGDQSKSILIIAPVLPACDRASESFRLFKIIELLRKSGHIVTFISRAPGAWANPASYIAKLEELGVRVFPVDPKKIFEKWGVKPDVPDIDLEKILQEGSFDVACLYFYDLAGQYIDEIRVHSPRTHIVVDSMALQFLRDQRGAALFPNPELINRLREMKNAELGVYRRADTVITTTGADREVLLRESPGLSVEVVPNIHPIPKEKPASFHSRQDFLFIGSFMNHPNFDAMQFFCSETWPIISSKLPQAKLYIVGDSPHPEVRALANERIIVTGYVPDTAPYLQRCRVSIAPLRYGAGMKGKVGEALACGLPVVATSIAVEGTGLKSGSNVIVADGAADFADAAVALYQDEQLWNRLSANGKEFIKKHYSPEAVAANLENALFKSFSRAHETNSVKQRPIGWYGTVSRDAALSTGAKPQSLLPLVSVIIPTYNRPDQLLDAIRSVQGQTYANIEIIVVNDCGTEVGNIVASMNRKKNITYYRHAVNSGLGAARNTAIKLSKGTYITYLDDDDIFYPNHVETLVSFLANSGHKVAYTNAVRAYQVKQNGKYVTTRKELAYTNEFDNDVILLTNLIPVLSVMHEKSCIDDVGPFDEALTTLEDWELWIRMSRKYEFVHIPEITSEVTWRTDGTTMSSSKRPDFLRTHKMIFERYWGLTIEKPNVLAARKKALQKIEMEISKLGKEPLTASVEPAAEGCGDRIY
jgi:glycosyltransferase involved in cell wall biosynthesis